ncbi:MAG: cobyric acid synthase CobQ [Acidobacteria bacterium]|nr:MAG: cobyric acid synthase CobQ [Acidobacteriota bacterium]
MHTKNRKAKCLSILGTGSDVGKSIVVTALCRIFSNMGIRVVPYKAQNMSNNSCVTGEGREIGRAQIVQAQAARLESTVDMNPVLLKPCSDTGSQIVLHGKPAGNCLASNYLSNREFLFNKALESLDRLRDEYEMVVMEGAGSCAEVNLRKGDIVNFRMAHASDAPVILVADIDRGGVFAQIIGTLHVIPEEDLQRVKGFIINRFRGDASLFKEGIRFIEEKTRLPVLGLVPYYRDIEIDSEDGVTLEAVTDPLDGPVNDRLNIACLRLPHISNFTDFNALVREDIVNFQYLSKPRSLNQYDLLILPGTKNVRGDMNWLRESGWLKEIVNYKHTHKPILGICGGYQILGKTIDDPCGVEGNPGSTEGLGFLEVTTTLTETKVTTRTTGEWLGMKATQVRGYEIHMGLTRSVGKGKPVMQLKSRNREAMDRLQGWQTEDEKIQGVYLHGLFDEPAFRKEYLKKVNPKFEKELNRAGKSESAEYLRDLQYEKLAQHFVNHVDIQKIRDIVWNGQPDT